MDQAQKETVPRTTQVEASDVIRIILQFLKESNLKRTLQCLQEESSVALNTVDNLDAFRSDILKGKWDTVIQVVGQTRLPDESLYLLYEQIVCELVEQQELSTASFLLRETTPLQTLKNAMPIRYRRLEKLVLSNRAHVDAKELYEGLSKDKKRQMIAKDLLHHLQQAPPSRLMALIGMGLKWKQQHGLLPPGETFNLLTGMICLNRKTTEHLIVGISSSTHLIEERVETIVRSIKFGKKTPAQCVVFSPDGRYVVTGSTDGLIEIWDWTTGQLTFDLPYQEQELLMGHDTAVLAIAFSQDMSLLVSGCKSGNIKVWKFLEGKCIYKLANAHDQGISSICFNGDASQILTSSFDFSARLHGIQSGKTLRHFNGHTSYVNTAIFNGNESRVVSGSSDGQVKIWDTKTGNCLLSFSPPTPIHMNETLALSVLTLFKVPKMSEFPSDAFFVCTKSNTLYLMNESGHVIKKYSTGRPSGSDFVAAVSSARGNWIYCAGEDHVIYTFSGPMEVLEAIDTIHTEDIINISHHPTHSVLATISFDGDMHLLQP